MTGDFGDLEDRNEEDSEYLNFLRNKRVYIEDQGVTIDPGDINKNLWGWQNDSVRYMLRRGRGALFAECGLGKTAMQLEYMNHAIQSTGGLGLILCPLAVAKQTVGEFEKFDISGGKIPIAVCDDHDSIPFKSGIVVTNYDKRHHFKTESFSSVVVDEGSILKNYTGKTKQDLCQRFRGTPFRLSATATPSPNDQLEIGNQSEFLGAMPSNEMISRWFINDSMQVGKYRLRGHAAEDFWNWVSSWAVSIEYPSDLGYSDEGYVLPELTIEEHSVIVDEPSENGQLFRNESVSATTIHKEKRLSNCARAEVISGLVNNSSEAWIVWCDTDYEADELKRRIPDAVEVRGSHPEQRKVRDIESFTYGQSRVIITKSSICGFGLNWQHCRNVAFAGVSYSFEQWYQAVRRVWRFGQKLPVNIHVALSPAEEIVWRVVKHKWNEHRSMKRSMSGAMKASQMEYVRGSKKLDRYVPTQKIILPTWI
jgi:superfamily II DNA or RNA helicase